MAVPSSLPSLRAVICMISAVSLIASTLSARVIPVPPGPASAISEAVASAMPGDIIQLQAGTYWGTVEISRSGAPEVPIVISGPASGERALIDGQGEPGKGRSNQAFRIRDASWIVIRRIDTRNSWTNIIDIRDSSYISITDCRFLDCGQTAVFAAGPASHHILVEHCFWSQDARIYSTWDWVRVHHEDLDHYNGGFYGGSDAAGGCVIRFNTIRDVFNGLRWYLKAGDAAQKKYQANIEIYENSFFRCRDNCVEPEVFAWNLHIYHNRFDSCPNGVASIDGVAGGSILFYGNTGIWNPADQPGPKSGAIPRPVSWAVIKFSDYGNKPPLEWPLWIYHNSWFYDRIYPRGSRVRKANDRVIQYNNAFLHQTNHMGLDEWPGKECIFDYDISSQPWSPDVIALGFEKHGIPATDPKFLAPAQGDFRLAPDSAARDSGRVIDGFTLWYLGAAPDRGAYEGDQRIYGMPFLYNEPPGGALYQEQPRIVRVFSRGARLVLFFSTPIDQASFSPASLVLSLDGRRLSIVDVRFSTDEHLAQAVAIGLSEPLPPDAAQVGIALGSSPPRGRNGQPATLWAADSRLVRIPGDATLVPAFHAFFTPPAD